MPAEPVFTAVERETLVGSIEEGLRAWERWHDARKFGDGINKARADLAIAIVALIETIGEIAD